MKSSHSGVISLVDLVVVGRRVRRVEGGVEVKHIYFSSNSGGGGGGDRVEVSRL